MDCGHMTVDQLLVWSSTSASAALRLTDSIPLRGARLALIALAGGDDLATGGDQVEVVLAGRALLEHELRGHSILPFLTSVAGAVP
jgi:hypothetical protein